MSRRTKKLGSAAKWGARYGLSVKKQVRAIDDVKKVRYSCPRCCKTNVKRVSSGIWECRSCSLKFTGGAYQPTTGKFKMLESRFTGE